MTAPKTPKGKTAMREARQAEALRENLRKRKAQARERGAKGADAPQSEQKKSPHP